MITAPTQFSGLQVWLDASDTTRLFQLSGGTTAVAANLDPVGYWGDKSGNNRHFTNIGGSATTRPTWVSSLSTVRFDGTNDFLSSIFSVNFANQSVFLVVSLRSYVNIGRLYGQVNAAGTQDTGANNFVPLIQNGAAGALATNIDSAGTRSTVSTRSLNSYDVISHVRSGGTLQNFVDGSGASSYTSANTTYTSYASRLGMGFATTFGGTFNPSTVDISEVIVYNRALTNLERADVEYYLTRKWNFLNSIPRQVYGIKNGLWSLTDTWSVSAEPFPWNFPLSADNAYTNTFTITADSSTKVDTLRNSTLAPNILSGGSFVLADGVSLSANMAGDIPTNGVLLSSFVSTQAELNGTFTSNPILNATGTRAIVHAGSGVLNYTGPDVTSSVIGNSQSSNSLISNVSNGTINISKNISAKGGTGQITAMIRNQSSGTINVVGTLTNTGRGLGTISNESTGSVNLTGNLVIDPTATATATVLNQAGTGQSLIVGDIYSNTPGRGVYASAGTILIRGNVYGQGTPTLGTINLEGTSSVYLTGNCVATNGANGIYSTVTTTSAFVYGNIINAPNGRQAIYAPRYQVFPTGSAQYTRQASNGYDSYVDYWTSNSTFSYPASSDVALGTTYSNSTLSGSMAIPSASSVALGALVGTTTGTASITLDNILSQPIANLTTPNSIGARLKNITTSQALSAIVDSLEF